VRIVLMALPKRSIWIIRPMRLPSLASTPRNGGKATIPWTRGPKSDGLVPTERCAAAGAKMSRA